MGSLSIWWDEAADGATNMAADEVLAAEASRRRHPLARLYRWASPTVSLGAFQSIAEARSLGTVPGLGLVRRPSGGGAIVHGTDITYAVAIPADHPWSRSPEALYRAVHRPLVDELVSRGDRAGLTARLHDERGPPGRGAADAFFCFSRRSPGDVVVHPTAAEPSAPPSHAPVESPVGDKVLGGAQRRLAGVVIQHGSLLIHANEAVPVAWRHPGVREVGFDVTDGMAVARSWMTRLAATLGSTIAWEPESFLDDAARRRETDQAALRYREARWLERR